MIFVKRDLDTLLMALYVLIDDHVIASGQRRPGHPKLGEREVAQELLGHARDLGALRDGMIVPADGPPPGS